MASRMGRRRRSGRGRRTAREFEWARTVGTLSGPGTLGANLLDEFETEFGAQLVGATVTAIRGYAVPVRTGTPGAGFITGQWGVIIESDNDLDDPTDVSKTPLARPHEDWFVYQPFWMNAADGGPPQSAGSANNEADSWALHAKSSRQIKTLGQGVHIWYSTVGPGGVGVDLEYDLSILVKMH